MNVSRFAPPRRHLETRLLGLLVALVLCGCTGSSTSSAPDQSATSGAVDGTVKTAWGEAVSGALVYLIPAEAVVTSPIDAAAVLDGSAESHDEPLEDLIRNGSAASYPVAETADDGSFRIGGVDKSASYFPYVAVETAQPSDVYPGGSLSRAALEGDALSTLSIEVTGYPPPTATYVGSSTCLICHEEHATQKVHAHRLGFRRPGLSTRLQDLSRIPDFDDGVTLFADASAATQGTPLWYHDFDGSRGFDKFRVAQADPGDAEVQLFLWRDTADQEHKITMRNLINTGDPDRTFTVDLTYGGALYKQRYMLRIDDPGYEGRYPFLQYQHAGDDAHYDRTRNRWRDYHMDFFWDATAQMFKLPNKTKNIESNCMACHATGYNYFENVATGERLCDAVDDPEGTFDIDNDGRLDELNTGCEVCHGPGSEHVGILEPRHIVIPSLLPPARESLICGRCHDRVAGNDDRMNDQPLNANGEMPPPRDQPRRLPRRVREPQGSQVE